MPSNQSSSVVPFSSCLQSFPASGSFPMSQFFDSQALCKKAEAVPSSSSCQLLCWVLSVRDHPLVFIGHHSHHSIQKHKDTVVSPTRTRAHGRCDHCQRTSNLTHWWSCRKAEARRGSTEFKQMSCLLPAYFPLLRTLGLSCFTEAPSSSALCKGWKLSAARVGLKPTAHWAEPPFRVCWSAHLAPLCKRWEYREEPHEFNTLLGLKCPLSAFIRSHLATR